MEDFLNHLKSKGYKNRRIAYIQNGSWGPCAGRAMKAIVEQMKDITEVEPMVTIKSTMKAETVDELKTLADALVK